MAAINKWRRWGDGNWLSKSLRIVSFTTSLRASQVDYKKILGNILFERRLLIEYNEKTKQKIHVCKIIPPI